jgi:RNA polymerase sigma-70 factor, ECF subfamily
MSVTPDAARSATLLQRAQAGDPEARDALVALYLPRLRRWATGRLPARARTLLDTGDIVQETLVATFRNLPRLDLATPAAFQAYIRTALVSRLADSYRRTRHLPPTAPLESDLPDLGPSALERAVGIEALARYDAALARLADTDRQAIVMRIELCCDYDEIAAALGKTSAAHARVAVSRALTRLAREMHHARG